MNDCIWYNIKVCDGCCTCEQYLSMNSDIGEQVVDEYSMLVEEALKPLATTFAKAKGFKKKEVE